MVRDYFGFDVILGRIEFVVVGKVRAAQSQRFNNILNVNMIVTSQC